MVFLLIQRERRAVRSIRSVLIGGIAVLIVAAGSYWLGARGKYAQAIPQVRRGYFMGFNLNKTAISIDYPSSNSGAGFDWTDSELWFDAKGVSHVGGIPTCLNVPGLMPKAKVTIGIVSVAPVGRIFGAEEIYWLRCGW